MFYVLSSKLHFYEQSIPLRLLAKATYATAQFGSFESLTKKAEAAGDGMLLTLYQEACCGLASGAILACIGIPINSALACLRADVTVPVAQPLRSVFRIIYQKVSNEGVLALWKGGGCYANALMAYNMGMLASYNRSSNYFKESLDFGEDRARLGAGAVSGFFASACSLPFMNVDAIMRSLQRDANIVLKLGGPFKFYTGIAKFFAKNTPSIMVTWIFLEEIQKIEESIGL
ncbi:hypothetical protein F0562_001307 [Nyssa sinensis]|uniref:ADP,ATP carrier protein n=1 Tax=Nyssa sinensis TaxID=561372 RepID=A0A5J5C2V6_9ASTE|nr:hypothetical protein F0562_001307 [Nyssa sinensis]